MSLDAVQKVVFAEQTAGELKAEAENRGKALVAEAQRLGRQRFEEAISDAEKQGKAKFDLAEENANLYRAQVLEETRAECSRLREHAQARMETAVKLIIGKVVSGGWQ